MVTVLTPNETEAEILTGVEGRGPGVGLPGGGPAAGGRGQGGHRDDGREGLPAGRGEHDGSYIAAEKVNVVDTTAAGDAFTGSLAVGLGQGHSLRDAALFANRVAALCVTQMGAQPSMPTLEEVCRVHPNPRRGFKENQMKDTIYGLCRSRCCAGCPGVGPAPGRRVSGRRRTSRRSLS